MTAEKTQIVIEIAPDGAVSADVTEGPGGTLCLVALHKLLSELGEQTEIRKKPEFYRVFRTTESIKKGVAR